MSAEIIGRKQEVAELNDIYASSEAEFIAVYGRRRIGKTYLVKNFFRQKKCRLFYAMGLENGDLKQQLAKFRDELAAEFYPNLKIEVPESWMEAFGLLTTAIQEQVKKKHIAIFLDELPWMATPRSQLLEALAYYWNRHWSDHPKLRLVVCGSSSSWIIKKILKSKGGLHNRVTRKILLSPYDLKTTKEYLHYLNIKLTDKQVLEAYMVFGGVPFYLKQIKKRVSLTQSIDQLCFTKNGYLFDEFDNLFASLFREDVEAHVDLIRQMAKHPEGIARTDLVDQKEREKQGGTLSKRLQQLEQTGFILGFLPLDKKKKGLYYKVIDEYTLFYLTWIDPVSRSLIQQENQPHYWKGLYRTPRWYNWAGHAFEAVCYKHIPQIRKALQIPEGSVVGSWRFAGDKSSDENGTQIDLLFDRQDEVVSCCEFKLNENPYVIDKVYAKNLKNKMDVYKKQTGSKKQIMMCVVTVNGLKENLYSDDLVAASMNLIDFFN